MSSLSEEVRDKLCERATLLQLKAHEPAFLQGEPCDAFYVVIWGQLQVRLWSERNVGKQLMECHALMARQQAANPSKRAKLPSRKAGKLVSTLNAGQCFGEMAFTTGGRRNASVLAADDYVALMVVSRSDFERVMSSVQVAELNEKLLVLRGPLGVHDEQCYTARNLAKLAYAFAIECASRGATVLFEGDAPSRFYVVKDGVLRKCVRGARKRRGLIEGVRFRDRAAVENAENASRVPSLQLLVSQVGAGECVGDYACLFQKPEPVSVIVGTAATELFVCQPDALIGAYESLNQGARALAQLRRNAAQRHEFETGRIDELVRGSAERGPVGAEAAVAHEPRARSPGGVRGWLTRQASPGGVRLRDAVVALEHDAADALLASEREAKAAAGMRPTTPLPAPVAPPSRGLAGMPLGAEGSNSATRLLARALSPSVVQPPSWLTRAWKERGGRPQTSSLATRAPRSTPPARGRMSEPPSPSPSPISIGPAPRISRASFDRAPSLFLPARVVTAPVEDEPATPPPAPSRASLSKGLPAFLHMSASPVSTRPSKQDFPRARATLWWEAEKSRSK